MLENVVVRARQRCKEVDRGVLELTVVSKCGLRDCRVEHRQEIPLHLNQILNIILVIIANGSKTLKNFSLMHRVILPNLINHANLQTHLRVPLLPKLKYINNSVKYLHELINLLIPLFGCHFLKHFSTQSSQILIP